MRVSVVRKNVKLLPDSKRVVARYFMNGQERTQQMVLRIMMLDENKFSRLWSRRFVSLQGGTEIFRQYFSDTAKEFVL